MDYLDQTIEVWQPYSEQPLTREDAREIAHNVMGFFQILRQWANEEKVAAAILIKNPSTPSEPVDKMDTDCLSPSRRRPQKGAAMHGKSGR